MWPVRTCTFPSTHDKYCSWKSIRDQTLAQNLREYLFTCLNMSWDFERAGQTRLMNVQKTNLPLEVAVAMSVPSSVILFLL